MFDGKNHLDAFEDMVANADPIEKLEINADLSVAACMYNQELNDFDSDTAY